MTLTEDMGHADAVKYVFKRFRLRLPEVLQELYFVAAKKGNRRTLKEAKKLLKEQEWVDALQVAAKRWRAIKVQHDGADIRLRDWRDFRGQYVLLPQNLEDWNKGDEQSRLLNLLPDARLKRVRKKKVKRAKSNHPVKMMLDKDEYRNWRIGQEPKWPGTPRGSPCGTPSSSPSQGIAGRQRSGAWTRVRLAAGRSVGRQPWRR